jgi:hypothetical protein
MDRIRQLTIFGPFSDCLSGPLHIIVAFYTFSSTSFLFILVPLVYPEHINVVCHAVDANFLLTLENNSMYIA